MHNQQYTHDFHDGNGSVPAFRHRNGGGWVSFTAHVDETVYIGKNARVFGHAHVKGSAVVKDNAQISGFSIISGYASIEGDTAICGHAVIDDHVTVKDCRLLTHDAGFHGDGEKIISEYNFNPQNCLECPALLSDNYMAGGENPCLYCMSRMQK